LCEYNHRLITDLPILGQIYANTLLKLKEVFMKTNHGQKQCVESALCNATYERISDLAWILCHHYECK